jgi:phosphate transport system substrate-binding protein
VLTRTALAGVAMAALALAGCASGENPSDDPSSTESTDPYAGLTGSLDASGASFPNAYYQAALDAFAEVAPELEIQYRSTGSGTGKKEFGENITSFAGTDSTVKEGDGPAAGSFYYIPTVAGSITVSYNLAEVDELYLSGPTLAKIFSRTITSWDDPAIAEDNPDADLPARDIVVVHRSDGSGTTNNFTKFLVAAGGSDWTLGSGDTVNWPADTQAGDKNTGVAQAIQQADGAIGYVDYADAEAAGLTFAAIKNKDGEYVAPSLEAATAALAGAELNDDLTYNPLFGPGAGAYPITAPTYILVRPSYDDAEEGAAVKGFITWLLTGGRDVAGPLGFAVLPEEIQAAALEKLESVSLG